MLLSMSARLNRPSTRLEPSSVAGSVALTLCFLAIYWAVDARMQWWAYDFGVFVRDGAINLSTTRSSVIKMGFLLTVFTGATWLFALRQRQPARSLFRRSWNITWQTWLVLFGYFLIIFIRRQTWEESKGESEWAMFFGSLNTEFFAETGWIVFLIAVIPLSGLLSGILFWSRGWLGAMMRGNRGKSPAATESFNG